MGYFENKHMHWGMSFCGYYYLEKIQLKTWNNYFAGLQLLSRWWIQGHILKREKYTQLSLKQHIMK